MKNLIVITSLLAAGTLAANAAITLDYASVGNFNSGTWYGDREIALANSGLDRDSGFYTFATSAFDFSNLKSATFSIYLNDFFSTCNLKIWAVECGNTDLSEKIANDIIENVVQSSGFVSTSLTTAQKGTMLSIDITSVLKNIKTGNDVAILIGADSECGLDDENGPTTLSVEFSAVPEPSMFGLFAGTLALALAGTRRRRRK